MSDPCAQYNVGNCELYKRDIRLLAYILFDAYAQFIAAFLQNAHFSAHLTRRRAPDISRAVNGTLIVFLTSNRRVLAVLLSESNLSSRVLPFCFYLVADPDS
jgi:hypothetical protein